MHRRRYLESGIALSLAGLAGCLDDTRTSSDGGADTEDGDDARVPDRKLRRAVGRLNRAAASLEGLEDDLESPANATFDAAEPTGRIEEARSYLEEARSHEAVTDEQLADAEAIEHYADLLEALVTAVATLLGDSEADPAAVRAAIADGRLGDARESVDALLEALEALEADHEAATETLADLDADRLAERDAVAVADLEAGFDALGTTLDSLLALARATEALVAGYEHLERGEAQFMAEAFEAAAEAFADATAAFEASTATIVDASDEAISGLEDDFSIAFCQSSTLVDAAEAFEESATTAAAGDLITAQARRAEGQRLVRDAEACTA